MSVQQKKKVQREVADRRTHDVSSVGRPVSNLVECTLGRLFRFTGNAPLVQTVCARERAIKRTKEATTEESLHCTLMEEETKWDIY